MSSYIRYLKGLLKQAPLTEIKAGRREARKVPVQRLTEADMSNTPHTLGEEFPGQMDQIHALKVADPAFARLLESYDAVNDAIHRAETNVEPVGQDHETALRKERLAIKDRIAQSLQSA